jgi:hypothetical protein
MVDKTNGRGSNSFLNLVTSTIGFSAKICLSVALATLSGKFCDKPYQTFRFVNRVDNIFVFLNWVTVNSF